MGETGNGGLGPRFIRQVTRLMFWSCQRYLGTGWTMGQAGIQGSLHGGGGGRGEATHLGGHRVLDMVH